jgi:hypothetical protein
VQLAGEARGVVVVLDAATIACEPRCAVLPLLAAFLSASRAGAGLGWPWWPGFGLPDSSSAAASAAARRARSASASSRRLRSAISSARWRSLAAKRLLFGLVALARLGQLAVDLGHFGIGIDRPAAPGLFRVTFLRTTTSIVLGPRPVLPPPPTVISCLRLRLSTILPGAASSAALSALAVRTLEEAQQLDFLDAGDDLVGAAEAHAGLGQLLQQFLDRRVHQFGQLADGGLLRHSDSGVFGRDGCGRISMRIGRL